MNLLRLATLLLLLAGTAGADVESDLRHAGSLGGIRLAESEEPAARKVYIVQLSAPPAAVFNAKTQPRARKTDSLDIPEGSIEIWQNLRPDRKAEWAVVVRHPSERKGVSMIWSGNDREKARRVAYSTQASMLEQGAAKAEAH